MSIQDWPADERPRERLLQQGPEALSDAELLAILLRQGRRGQTVLDLARSLLTQYHGLAGIFSLDQQTLCQHPGFGPVKYCQLHAALELSRRHLRESLRHMPAFHTSQQTLQFIVSSLRACTQEVFAALFLDNQHRLIQFEKLFYGTINSAMVYPREVAKRALRYNAAALIVAHNHPSGAPEPSLADQQLTEQLRETLNLLDIRLLDHIIVADNQAVSLAERGWC